MRSGEHVRSEVGVGAPISYSVLPAEMSSHAEIAAHWRFVVAVGAVDSYCVPLPATTSSHVDVAEHCRLEVALAWKEELWPLKVELHW